MTDTTPGSLSYSGKIFMANRLTVIPSANQTQGIQLLEITNTDNLSTESITYQ
jgi:hypothetical protein